MTTQAAVEALNRAQVLLDILGRQHTHRDLYNAARAVGHEVQTARAALTSMPKPEAYEGERVWKLVPGRSNHRMLAELDGAGPEGSTTIALAFLMGISESFARRCRWELGQLGLVAARRDKDQQVVRVMGLQGRMRTLWVLTDLGERVLRSLQSVQIPLDLEGVTVGAGDIGTISERVAQ